MDEETQKGLWRIVSFCKDEPDICVGEIVDFLSKVGYVKLSKNQDIPENPYEFYLFGARVWHQEDESKGFKCCAEQMIKDNFRRVEDVD